MQKAEALKIFLEKDVTERSRIFLLSSLDELKIELRQKKIEAFVIDFLILLNECEKSGESVRYIQLSLIRSKALSNKPFYILEAYGSLFYLSQPIAVRELSLDWFYEKFKEFCESVKKDSRKYILKIGGMELDRIILAELINCNRLLKYLLEESLVHIMNLKEFTKLKLSEGIQIQMGEYRGPFETIMVTNEYTDNLGRWWNGIL
ncbi:hypothetical protein [Lacrimispora sp.]|uniref:hypothetical protein n=1 Tax=Lacrimispora sp. TaxID=2719234 RepID=UPI0032E49DCA